MFRKSCKNIEFLKYAKLGLNNIKVGGFKQSISMVNFDDSVFKKNGKLRLNIIKLGGFKQSILMVNFDDSVLLNMPNGD